ncbi:MAG: CHASE domain-containing protein [Lentisphaerota bacterium]
MTVGNHGGDSLAATPPAPPPSSTPLLPKQDRNARWPWWFTGLTCLTGMIITLWLWHARSVIDQRALEEGFQAEAESVFQSTPREVDLFMNVLDSIRQLHNVSDHISAEDFDEFVQKGMQFQLQVLGSFGFVQRINQDLRKSLENPTGPEGQSSLRILESSDGKKFVPAGERPEYYPLTYQRPQDAMGLPLGFDFISRKTDRAAIELMKTTGRFALGNQVLNPDNPEEARGFYVFAPIVYADSKLGVMGSPLFLIGFAVSIINPNELLARIVPNPASRGLSVQLMDPGLDGFSTTSSEATDAGNALTADFTVMVADHVWILRCKAEQEYLRAHQAPHSILILLAGLIITGLLTSLMILLANRTRQIERTVHLRTTALRDTNKRLQEEMTERMRLESEILEIGSREKQRVGQDLHDSIGQKLTGAVFLSRTLMDKLSGASEEDRANARRVNETLKETVAQVRRVARGLAPVELSEEGLNDALKRLADNSQDLYDISCQFRCKSDSRVKDIKTATHLYHIAQEAINNATRHGKAGEVIITLATTEGDGKLVIEDDGEGMPQDADRKGGLGLKIMRYRSEMIGGWLDIRNRPEGGTTVSCIFSDKGGK